MIELKMKNYNIILIENQQNYQDYHLEKFINIEYPAGQVIIAPDKKE